MSVLNQCIQCVAVFQEDNDETEVSIGVPNRYNTCYAAAVLEVLGSLGVISQLLKSKHVMESATLAAMMELLQGQVSVKFLAS